MLNNKLATTFATIGVALMLTGCTSVDLSKIDASKVLLGKQPTKAEIEKQRVADAKAYETRLLADLRKMHNSNDPNEAYQLADLARFYDNQKRNGEASLMIARAKQTYCKSHGNKDAGIAYFLATQAKLLAHQGRVGQAEKLEMQYLAINQKALPKDSIKLVPTLCEVSSFYTDTNNFRKAQPYLKRAIAICEKYPEDRSEATYNGLKKSYAVALKQTAKLKLASK